MKRFVYLISFIIIFPLSNYTFASTRDSEQEFKRVKAESRKSHKEEKQERKKQERDSAKQKRLVKKQERKVTSNRQEEDDLKVAIVLSLSTEATPHSVTSTEPSKKVRMTEEEKTILLSSFTAFGDTYNHNKGRKLNVHTLNRACIKRVLPSLITIDETYLRANPTIPFATIQDEIVATYVYRSKKKTMDKIIQKIIRYLKNPQDKETGGNLKELLSRVWDLSSRLPDGQETVCLSLAENIEENGGCKPGIVGRLCVDYLLFIRTLLLEE